MGVEENYGTEFGIKEKNSTETTTVLLRSVDDEYMGLSLTTSIEGELGFKREAVSLQTEHITALRDALSAFLIRQGNK